jgi:NADH-quinone oxidoreductase subunit J
MSSLLFYVFAAITLLFGIGVVVAKNPVASALSLVVSFAGLAALFISLDAYFIGIIQILVYAGAVMVLFLFIIMLLDIQAEEAKRSAVWTSVGGAALAILFILQVATVLNQSGAFSKELPKLDTAAAAAPLLKADAMPSIRADLQAGTLPDTKMIGYVLFDKYPFHLQMVALLLLAGTVGVVVLSRRDGKDA